MDLGKTILPKIKSFYFQASNLMKHIQKYAMKRLTLSLLSIQAFSFTHSPHSKDNKYNSDSYLIGIDNHASASVTNSEDDFIITPTPIDLKVKGIKGYLKSTKIGTVRWNIQDDEGCTHQFDIPGTYLVKELPLRLFSTQNVAKEMIKKDTHTKGLTCITHANKVLLKWKQYTQTIHLGTNNVHILR
jgi:hypothetical protein